MGYHDLESRISVLANWQKWVFWAIFGHFWKFNISMVLNDFRVKLRYPARSRIDLTVSTLIYHWGEILSPIFGFQFWYFLKIFALFGRFCQFNKYVDIESLYDGL